MLTTIGNSSDSVRTQRIRPLQDRFLDIKMVCLETSRCRSGIYQMVKDQQFPRPRKLGARRVGWLASEVEGWIQSRIAAA